MNIKTTVCCFQNCYVNVPIKASYGNNCLKYISKAGFISRYGDMNIDQTKKQCAKENIKKKNQNK